MVLLSEVDNRDPCSKAAHPYEEQITRGDATIPQL